MKTLEGENERHKQEVMALLEKIKEEIAKETKVHDLLKADLSRQPHQLAEYEKEYQNILSLLEGEKEHISKEASLFSLRSRIIRHLRRRLRLCKRLRRAG